MLTLADKGGRRGVTNDDNTDTIALKKANLYIFFKVRLGYYFFFWIYDIFSDYSYRGRKAHADKADKKRGGG